MTHFSRSILFKVNKLLLGEMDKGISSKSAIYHIFKSELEPERYLLMSNWNCISSLARFRCSNHKLVIEEGRHNAINLENRLCKFCDSIQVCMWPFDLPLSLSLKQDNFKEFDWHMFWDKFDIMQVIFTHLKLWVAVATHNFKWVKIQVL